ncbi:MAG: RNA polymerase Rpb4 family protein [Candidatus Asgardarchaeia archaeon]
MPRKILDRKLLTYPEVKEILSKRSESDELNYIQRVTLDYVTKFSKMSVKTARKLIETLINKYSLDEEIAYQIVNVAPTTPQELSVFIPATTSLTKDDLKDIAELIKSSIKEE